MKVTVCILDSGIFKICIFHDLDDSPMAAIPSHFDWKTDKRSIIL